MGTAEKRWDIFLSHAAEDKASVARPLADALRKAGARVWLDEHELSVGDSLSQKIDEGLSQSHFGGVILSQAFFAKHWPRKELSGLRAREEEGQKVILPIWHNIDKSTIAEYSPTLADSVGVSTNDGIPTVAANLLDVIFAPTSGSPSAKSPSAGRRLVEILDSDNPAPELLTDFLSFHLSKVAHKIGLRTSVTVRKYEWEGIAFDAYVPYVGHGCALYLLSFTGSWKDPFMAHQELQIEPVLSSEIVQTISAIRSAKERFKADPNAQLRLRNELITEVGQYRWSSQLSPDKCDAGWVPDLRFFLFGGRRRYIDAAAETHDAWSRLLKQNSDISIKTYDHLIGGFLELEAARS